MSQESSTEVCSVSTNIRSGMGGVHFSDCQGILLTGF